MNINRILLKRIKLYENLNGHVDWPGYQSNRQTRPQVFYIVINLKAHFITYWSHDRDGHRLFADYFKFI